MSLREIQKDIIQFLYTFEPDTPQKDRIRSYFLHPERSDPHNGLGIYRSNLIWNLIGAMQESYPMTRVLLGENNFKFFCRDFIYQHPSHQTDLIQYGEGFGEFLATRGEISPIGFIADVARLEWALERVFYAPTEKSFSGDLSLNWQKDPPRFKKAIRFIQTQYQVYEAWQSFIEKGKDAIEAEMFKREMEHLVVWSDEGVPKVTLVNPTLGVWIKGMMGDKNALSPSPSAEFLQVNQLEAYVFAIRQGWIAS